VCGVSIELGRTSHNGNSRKFAERVYPSEWRGVAFMHKAYEYQQSCLYIHSTQMLLAADLIPWPPTHTKRPRYLPDARSQHNSKGVRPMSRSQFTRVPKIAELLADGVPLRAVPTYLALADHAHNRTGETFVSVVRVSEVLRVCRRTVERHLSALEAAGVIKRQRQRRGRRGRFGSCLRILVSFAGFTVRQRSTDRGRKPIVTRTKPSRNTPKSPPSREEQRARRMRGYEWLVNDV
jgi:DNA-binding transcriptional ArsR family regulator